MGNPKRGPARNPWLKLFPLRRTHFPRLKNPMMPSSPTPKIPLWIFILTDVALLLAGLLIAARSSTPLSSTAILSVVACVIAGVIVIFIPLVSTIEREKNEALDDRQRALEALASTVATAAEQISIAAQGLHVVSDLAQKNLALAEQLPAKFQDKIAEFEALLNSAQTDERDELKKELALLRASESDRLEAIAAKVDHASGELAKLEAAAHKHLTSAQAALASAPAALTAATADALAKISAALAVPPAAAPRDEARPSPEPAAKEPKSVKPAPKAVDEGLHIIPVVPPTAAPFIGDIVTIAPEITVAPFTGSLLSSEPLKPLSAPAEAAPTARPSDLSAPAPATAEVPLSGTKEGAPEEPKPVKKRAPRKPKPVETTELSPVAPPPDEPSHSPADEGGASTAQSEFSQIAPDESPSPAAEVVESANSSDGATRLLVTAYIGIGNRLFIRGEGPGLSWDKGVPLQFVSIGKWRWETNDATAPVKFKLYKNDEIECTALGAQSLSPDHQQEITATF